MDGLLDHLPREIHPRARGKSAGQRLRQPSHSTPEVQRGSGKVRSMPDRAQVPEDNIDFSLTGGHEFRDVPLAARLGGVPENGSQGIALGEGFPVVF